jgi:hypothetical protein
MDENGIPRDQALWGEREIAFGFAACTNRVEGTLGKLIARVDRLRNLKVRLTEITSAIVARAAT